MNFDIVAESFKFELLLGYELFISKITKKKSTKSKESYNKFTFLPPCS